MRNIDYQFTKMCNRIKGGSFATQATHRRLFSVIATDIEHLGFRNLDIRNLKPKHVKGWSRIGKKDSFPLGLLRI